MDTTTQTEVWPTDTPFVVFIVPADQPRHYASLMSALTDMVQEDLGWEKGTIETVGLISATPEQVIEGLYFLEDLGVNPRMVTLLITWGKTFDAIGFDQPVPMECGVGYVALPRSGVVLPVLRMPPIEDWWLDPLHQAHAKISYGEMVRQGRFRPTEVDPMMCIAAQAVWN